MDIWKDIYYGSIHMQQSIEFELWKKEIEIQELKQKLEENKKFFEKTFNKTIDSCMKMSYNEYIKDKERN